MPDELAEYIPTLQNFAEENGMTLRRPSPDNPEEWDRSDYQYRLGFANTHNQLCFLYVGRDQPDEFQVRLQRWGLHRLIASEQWPLPYDADPSELRSVLTQAAGFADTPLDAE